MFSENGCAPPLASGDIDVVRFDNNAADRAFDATHEAQSGCLKSLQVWALKNQ
jgi:hypothetical protein